MLVVANCQRARSVIDVHANPIGLPALIIPMG